MTDKLKEVIKREVGKLPKENQDVINSFGWENISEEIGKRYLLTESELNDFQVQILLVLVGLVEVDYFQENIEVEVGTSKNEAEKMAAEVFQKIFTPISDTIVENLKKDGKFTNTNTEQNLNFILSGGDYSAFLEQRNGEENTETEEAVVPVFSITKENLKAN
jgi:hypothetical protein